MRQAEAAYIRWIDRSHPKGDDWADWFATGRHLKTIAMLNWIGRGRPEGDDWADWFAAEQQGFTTRNRDILDWIGHGGQWGDDCADWSTTGQAAIAGKNGSDPTFTIEMDLTGNNESPSPRSNFLPFTAQR